MTNEHLAEFGGNVYEIKHKASRILTFSEIGFSSFKRLIQIFSIGRKN